MALVTVSELKKYMDITLSNTQEQGVQLVIDGLHSEMESYLRRPIEQTAYTETHVVANHAHGVPTNSFFYDYSLDTTNAPVSMIQPPYVFYAANSPVVSVASLTIRPQTQATATAQEEGRDFVVRKYGIDLFRAFANDVVTVTYTGGLDGSTIKMMKLLILRAATREVQNMHDDVVGLKDLETRNVAPMQTGFLDAELQSLRRYRRVRVA